MRNDIRSRWNKKLTILHDLLIVKTNQSNLLYEVKKCISSHRNILRGKYYIDSNLDDLLWFRKNGLSNNQKLLDLGTGGGYIPYLLSDVTRNLVAYEYIGEWKDQHYKNSTYSSAFHFIYETVNEIEPNIQFKLYNKLPLKEKSESFDGIILYAVIEHIDSIIKDKILKEVYRILKPDGFLFIAKLPRLYSYQEFISDKFGITCHTDLYTKKRINKLLNRHSFKVIKIEKTGLFINTHTEITDRLSFIFIFLEKFLKYTPLNLFSHDYRLIAQKI